MKIKQIKTNVDPCLDTGEIEFFYKLLLRCESKQLTGYNYNDKKLQGFIKNENIILTYNKQKEKWGGITRESAQNEIQFINNKSSICASLFVHLRNAFAHGYIEKYKKTNVLHFQNVYQGECKMDGKMTFDTLKELIENMLKTKKIKEQ